MPKKKLPPPEVNLRRILGSPTYLRAYEDIALLHRVDLRPIRLQLEALKAEIVQEEEGIKSTLVFFGGSRIRHPEAAEERLRAAEFRADADPDNTRLRDEVTMAKSLAAMSRYYDEARRLAAIVSEHGQRDGELELVICTGGGPGIMEAGNRGAHEVGAKSIGLNITLPHEQAPNAYITPELCFQFHYFAIRKMHFLMRAVALVSFPGGLYATSSGSAASR
jgi:predicted Rossmann-fold nucleotide-binding protein